MSMSRKPGPRGRPAGGAVSARSRFVGCLLGGAVGDALGAAIEFHSREQIQARYGLSGLTEFAKAYGRIGAITDDTQMTLFTAEGLLRGHVRGALKGICHMPGVVANAYLRWLHTQGEANQHGIGVGADDELSGWLISHAALHHRRGPGNSCLSSLRHMQTLGEPVQDDRKGCGGVMRAAPVGLYGWRESGGQRLREVFTLGSQTAALTHGHPTGQLTAGALAVMVCLLVDGKELRTALALAIEVLAEHKTHGETLEALEHAVELAGADVSRQEAIAALGQGWVAEEALAIGVYCALKARDFGDGVVLAVNHSGDSDSTGSITGNLLGAELGVAAIPLRYLEKLELCDVITEMAGDLHDHREWQLSDDMDEHTAQIWSKYPGF
jgi:ADP-ribosylglycohydrolase